MTLARVRRPTCAARLAAWKASPSTYTPPWKYSTTWRGSTPPTVISAAGTPPSAAAVTVTPAGSGCADVGPLLKFPPGRRAAASLAARQVRRRHRITVIRATGDFHRELRDHAGWAGPALACAVG